MKSLSMKKMSKTFRNTFLALITVCFLIGLAGIAFSQKYADNSSGGAANDRDCPLDYMDILT